MHPMLEEFCRAHPAGVRPEVFRRWQRTIRDDISPKLDERDRLLAENAELVARLTDVKAANADLQKQLDTERQVSREQAQQLKRQRKGAAAE